MLGLGEKLRTARTSKNLSLRELAAKAEVSASLLSQIENGKANPSVRSLHSIADALSVPIDHFFPGKNGDSSDGIISADGVSNLTASEFRAAQVAAVSAEDSGQDIELPAPQIKSPIIRGDARTTIELEGGVTWARLTPDQEDGIEFLQIHYDVGASSGKKMSHHTGREFGLVLEGELQLDLGFERYTLKAGDSVVFDSTTPHRLTNIGQESMRAIWVVINRA